MYEKALITTEVEMPYRGATPGQRAGVDARRPTSVRDLSRFEAPGFEVEEGADAMPIAEKARLASEMRSRAGLGSDVRLDRVAEIRARILAGTYRVAVEDVAEKLMGALRR